MLAKWRSNLTAAAGKILKSTVVVASMVAWRFGQGFLQQSGTPMKPATTFSSTSEIVRGCLQPYGGSLVGVFWQWYKRSSGEFLMISGFNDVDVRICMFLLGI